MPAPAVNHGRPRVMIHPLTFMDASKAAQRCQAVAYTSVDFAGSHHTIVPPHMDDMRCVLVFVGQDTMMMPKAPWTYISHRRTNATRSMSRRTFSKIPKLSPDLLFPGRWTLFFDAKLSMHATLKELQLLYAIHTVKVERSHEGRHNRSRLQFVAWSHPALKSRAWYEQKVKGTGSHVSNAAQPAGRRFTAYEWMLEEASWLSTDNTDYAQHTVDHQLLRDQVQRYMGDWVRTPPQAYQAYIESAMLMQQHARPIFKPWREEFYRPDSSDRDQIAFAYTVARLRLDVHPLPACTELRSSSNDHLYRNATTGHNTTTLHKRGAVVKTLCAFFVDNSTCTVTRRTPPSSQAFPVHTRKPSTQRPRRKYIAADSMRDSPRKQSSHTKQPSTRRAPPPPSRGPRKQSSHSREPSTRRPPPPPSRGPQKLSSRTKQPSTQKRAAPPPPASRHKGTLGSQGAVGKGRTTGRGRGAPADRVPPPPSASRHKPTLGSRGAVGKDRATAVGGVHQQPVEHGEWS